MIAQSLWITDLIIKYDTPIQMSSDRGRSLEVDDDVEAVGRGKGRISLPALDRWLELLLHAVLVDPASGSDEPFLTADAVIVV